VRSVVRAILPAELLELRSERRVGEGTERTIHVAPDDVLAEPAEDLGQAPQHVEIVLALEGSDEIEDLADGRAVRAGEGPEAVEQREALLGCQGADGLREERDRPVVERVAVEADPARVREVPDGTGQL